jgi:hypothetical protein
LKDCPEIVPCPFSNRGAAIPAPADLSALFESDSTRTSFAYKGLTADRNGLKHASSSQMDAIHDTCEYTRSLIQERRRDLRMLEERYRQQRLRASDYQSCSGSLLKAIDELEILLRSMEPKEFSGG